MKIGVSTHIHVYKPLDEDLLNNIKRAGYETVELYCNHPHFPGYVLSKKRAEIAGLCQDFELDINSIHTPFFRTLDHAKRGKWYSVTSRNQDIRIESVEKIIQSILIAEHAKVEAAVVHLGCPEEKEDFGTWDRLYYSLEEILKVSSSLNVTVALENITNDFSRGHRIRDFIEESKLDSVGCCYDCGHATLYGVTVKELEEMSQHLVTTHIHDTTEGLDNHLLPFTGEIEWDVLAAKFAEINYTGDLIIETKDISGSFEILRESALAAEKLRDMIRKKQ